MLIHIGNRYIVVTIMLPNTQCRHLITGLTILGRIALPGKLKGFKRDETLNNNLPPARAGREFVTENVFIAA